MPTLPLDPTDFSKTRPTLQVNWSANSLGTLKTCPQRYMREKIQGWRRKGNIHLDFGSKYAEAMDVYQKARETADHESALRAVVKHIINLGTRTAEGVWQPWDTNKEHKDYKLKNRDTLMRAVVWYLEEFKDNHAQTIRLADGTFASELTFKFGTTLYAPCGTEYTLHGKLDRLVDFGGDVFVLDNKTTKSTISNHYFKQFTPNNQITLYTLAGQIVFNAKVKGVIIDAAQLAVGFARFSRALIFRTQRSLDEYLKDLTFWLRAAEQYAEADHWPMNDTACDKFGGCPFREICAADPGVRDMYLKTSFERRVVETQEGDD